MPLAAIYCGFWLYCFNQINATGIKRRHTKRIEKIFILLCFLLPMLIGYSEWSSICYWLFNRTSWWPTDAYWFRHYGAWCLASSLVLGVLWLESRLWIIPPSNLLHTEKHRYNVHREIEHGSVGDNLTRWLHRIPGNEIARLDVTKKQLKLARSIQGLDGFRIGHLSDLHFTGQFRPDHYHFIIDRLLELEPDFIAITGDIIDFDRCLNWVEPILGRLSAPYGCAFVLGNHDCRLSDLPALTDTLVGMGMRDAGAARHMIQMDRGSCIEIIGNERPWLRRSESPARFELASAESGQTLRLALCHSPDQLKWARRQRADLMLAGHTHGGQVRFPGIGPIVAPSHYGSRYASGVFYKPPTLIHVSRGVAGTHPVRWRCAPEVSVLTLRSD